MITEEKSKKKLLSSDFQVFDPIFQSILISIFDLFFNTETRERWLHYGNIIQELVNVELRKLKYLLVKWLGDVAREELVECLLSWGVRVKRVFQLRNLRKETE